MFLSDETNEMNETNRCEILSVPLNCNLLETRQQRNNTNNSQHDERGQNNVHVIYF